MNYPKYFTYLLLFSFLACAKTATTESEKPSVEKTETTEKGKYKLTFNATWSSSTHPKDFPSSPHFSGLIGMTHNADIRLFEVEKRASVGIRNMAEIESKSPLSDEIDAWISEKKQNPASAVEASADLPEALNSNSPQKNLIHWSVSYP